MGVYSWNNMQNLYEETSLNNTADLIIHGGDHCYNEGDDDEHRADAYMQAFEKTIANAPWMPIVGSKCPRGCWSGTCLLPARSDPAVCHHRS